MSGQIRKHQVARLVTDYKADGSTALPVKIMDINEDDTTMHTCDISAHVPPATKAICIHATRESGTGQLFAYPNATATGDAKVWIDAASAAYGHSRLIPITNQQLKYSQTVAADDFDLYLLAYFVEGPVGK